MDLKRVFYLTQEKFNKFIREHQEWKQCKKLCCLPTTVNSVKQLSELQRSEGLSQSGNTVELAQPTKQWGCCWLSSTVCPNHHVERFCLSSFTRAFWNTDMSLSHRQVGLLSHKWYAQNTGFLICNCFFPLWILLCRLQEAFAFACGREFLSTAILCCFIC